MISFLQKCRSVISMQNEGGGMNKSDNTSLTMFPYVRKLLVRFGRRSVLLLLPLIALTMGDNFPFDERQSFYKSTNRRQEMFRVNPAYHMSVLSAFVCKPQLKWFYKGNFE